MSTKVCVAKAMLASHPSSDFYPLSDDCLKGQYVTRQILERVRSYETGDFCFNRALSDEYMDRLDPKLKLPILKAFVHKQHRGPYESVIRLLISIPKHGRMPTRASELTVATVDLPIEDFLSLPILVDGPRPSICCLPTVRERFNSCATTEFPRRSCHKPLPYADHPNQTLDNFRISGKICPVT